MDRLAQSITDQAAIKKVIEIVIVENAEAMNCLSKCQRSRVEIIIIAKI
jgi:hypothetical protein